MINLAGRSVHCRYGIQSRREIMDSRVDSTRIIGKAIATAAQPPRLWLQASTATIYEHRFDAPNDELTGILGGQELNAPDTWRFSIDVATTWERVANEARPLPHTRLVLLRSAIVMSPNRGGAFDMLLRLVRLGLGGRNGDGRQFVSWIHEDDFIRAVYWLIDHQELSGPINLAAPTPLSNRDFMRDLRQAWGTRLGLPATKWNARNWGVFSPYRDRAYPEKSLRGSHTHDLIRVYLWVPGLAECRCISLRQMEIAMTSGKSLFVLSEANPV